MQHYEASNQGFKDLITISAAYDLWYTYMYLHRESHIKHIPDSYGSTSAEKLSIWYWIRIVRTLQKFIIARYKGRYLRLFGGSWGKMYTSSVMIQISSASVFIVTSQVNKPPQTW